MNSLDKGEINLQQIHTFIKTYWIQILLSFVYIFFVPVIFRRLQSFLYCGVENTIECKVWSIGFELVNYTLGAVFIIYFFAFLAKQKMSRILFLSFIIITTMYLVALVVLFLSYIKVNPTNIEFRDITNKIRKTTLEYGDIYRLEIITTRPENDFRYDNTYIIDTKKMKYGIGFGTDPIEYISTKTRIPITYSAE